MAFPTQDLLPAGSVALAGAGPGDPALLTLQVYRALLSADVVIHDRLVSPEILGLIPARTIRVDVGKEGFGPSTAQADIHAAMISHAKSGARVLRLKAGDPGIFGRLDEELDALDAAEVPWQIMAGLTAATVAAAEIGAPLTVRGRNGALSLLTGHDLQGFAEQDWRSLGQKGAVAAIYMGKKAARFLQGRLMMHGASPETPITLIENVSRKDQQIHRATLATLPAISAQCQGPAVFLFGIAPRAALSQLPALLEA